MLQESRGRSCSLRRVPCSWQDRAGGIQWPVTPAARREETEGQEKVHQVCVCLLWLFLNEHTHKKKKHESEKLIEPLHDLSCVW